MGGWVGGWGLGFAWYCDSSPPVDLQDVVLGSRYAVFFSSHILVHALIDLASQEFPEKDEDEADDAEEEL